MRKILKGVLILFVVAIALAFMPAQQTMAGTFTYDKSPNFTFTLPSWDKSPKTRNPNSVVRMTADPDELTTLDAGVSDLPEGQTFKDLPKDQVAWFEDTYNATNCEILYERDIKLSDGTPAYEWEIKWRHPAVLLYSYNVVAFKDKKKVQITVTSNDKITNNLKKYPLSLKFK